VKTSTKIHRLLTPQQRRSAAFLLGMMVIGMVLETLGVGLVIPIIALLMQSDPYTSYPKLRPFLHALGDPSQRQLVTWVMLALVAIYVVKATFLAFVAWCQTKFAFDMLVELSQRLFKTYLRQPYTFHLQRNSAQLIRNAVNEVSQVSTLITAVTGLITEGLVLVGVAALLLFVEPVGTIMMGVVLGGMAGLFHYATRNRLGRWGIARQYHEGLRMQYLQEGLGGAKDVKLLGRETEFLDQYQTHNLLSGRSGQLQMMLQLVPRLWLEVLAVSGLAAVALSMLAQGRSMASIVPTFGLFAAAAFRLLPSVNRLLNAAQTARYGGPVIDLLYNELQLTVPDPSPRDTPAAPIQREIALSHVSYTYPNAPVPSLTDLSLTVMKGESVGFIGASGAGKSTLVDVILGLLTPTEGVVTVDGRDIQRDLRAWQDQIGYVPQTIFLTDDTMRRNVAFGVPNDQIDAAAVDRAIKSAQLDEFVANLPNGLDTIVGERGVRISGGQRQRIGIARALYHDPPVLVLDEATSALNGEIERDVMAAVGALRGSKTILIVAHRLSTVEMCGRLYRLDRGMIVEITSYRDVVDAVPVDAP
jgi:ABC-type multidrug transport system fused ATPase/permease subunit